MMPAHIVKICGVTNAADAQAAAEAGASAVGFNFWPGSPRFIAPAEAARIAGTLPGGILKVGVFVDPDLTGMAAVAREAGLDVVQIHGDVPPGGDGLRCWHARRVGRDGELSIDSNESAEAILLDTAVQGMRGGTGVPFPWTAARGLQQRVIIAGGLDASNVRAAIREAQPWGVDACSRIETSPGRKDHDKMRAFIAEALEEFA